MSDNSDVSIRVDQASGFTTEIDEEAEEKSTKGLACPEYATLPRELTNCRANTARVGAVERGEGPVKDWEGSEVDKLAVSQKTGRCAVNFNKCLQRAKLGSDMADAIKTRSEQNWSTFHFQQFSIV